MKLPNRLHALRVRHDISLKELSEHTGVPAPSLSRYERNHAMPVDVLEKVAQFYQVPVTFFSHVDPDTTPLQYRRYADRKKAHQRADEVLVQWVGSIVDALGNVIDQESVTVPSWPVSPDDDVMAADAAAIHTRTKLVGHDEPVFGLFWLLESHGVVGLRLSDEEGKATDGYSSWVNNRPVVAIKARPGNVLIPRDRLSLAHELGHLVMHREVPADLTAAQHKRMEAQAFRFASVFLMPKSDPGWSEFSLRNFMHVKLKWGMSVSALVRRMFDDGFLDETRYRSLMVEISQKGWRRAEPGDEGWPEDTPAYLAEAIRWTVEEKAMPSDWLVSATRLTPAILSELTGLEAEFFEQRRPGFKFRSRMG